VHTAAAGRNELRRGGRVHLLPGKTSIGVEAGDSVRLSTPGGGGWGAPKRRRR